MAKNNREKLKFLEILEKTPLINYACKKSGIGRTSVYRWMKEDELFKAQVNDAIANGRSAWIDIAESALLKNVNEGKMDAIKFFLRHNDKRYVPVRSIYLEPLGKEERARYMALLRSKKDISNERMAAIERKLDEWLKEKEGEDSYEDLSDEDEDVDHSDQSVES